MHHLIGPILDHHHPSRDLQSSAAHSQDVTPGSSINNHETELPFLHVEM